MTQHIAHPDDRPEFLVDGCPRCEEYVRDLGVEFDAQRWRAFWAHVVAVEYDGTAHYQSKNDADLGRYFYRFMVGMQRAFGMHPSDLVTHFALTPEGLAASLGLGFIEVTDPRD